MIKDTLGKIYHPILHKMRNSPRLHFFAINKMVKKSLKNEERKPRLYVDVTNIHYKDTGTGIQRVTKEIASRIVNYNQNYDVICIYNRHFDGYFDCNTNEFITFSKGDIYFGLDTGIICNSSSTYEDLCLWLNESSNTKKSKDLITAYSLLGSDFSSAKKYMNTQHNAAQNISLILL